MKSEFRKPKAETNLKSEIPRRLLLSGLICLALVRPVLSADTLERPAAPQTIVKTVADAVLRDFPDPPPFNWGEGVATKVDSQRRVIGVSAGTTPTGKGRYAAVPVGTYPWGTGAFLMAASAYAESQPAAESRKSVTAKDGAEMVLVPAGPFMMGSLDGPDDEKPPHVVTLPAFYLDKFEVTHEQYAAFLKASGRTPPVDWPDGKMPLKLARHPVVNVTFGDAEAYAQWAGKRLPTEAEWEKACRGNDGRIYPWGNSPAGKKTATPLGDNSKDHTWPVGSFPDDVSPWGALDMAGNVWEWTASWYDAYRGNDQLEIAYGKKYRVIRGGGAIDYYGVASTHRCAARARSLPYGTYDALGFRCVMEANEK